MALNLNRGMQYAHIGLAIPAATVVGLFLGMWLDSFFGTTWIKIVGLILGVVAGFYDIIRAVQQMNKANAASPPASKPDDQ
jgi:F0F1-type ATP synthase assembly protein I